MTQDDDPLDSPNNSAPDLQILGDEITLQPSGYVEPEYSTREDSEQALMNQFASFRAEPLQFLREVSLYVSGQGWRAYDRIIGQPVFYSGFSERMKHLVMSAPLLQQRIAQLANDRLIVEESEGLLSKADKEYGTKRAQRRSALESSIQEVAEKLTDVMICKMESKMFIRSAYYVTTQLLTRAYHQGIHVSSEEVLRLRRVADAAAKRKQSIIFLPSHRSHVDYIALQLICYRLGLTLPIVVGGENLNFPVVGALLQHVGSMWIRRSFGDDALYSTLVQAYIDTILQQGYNFECFIEGGRSRTGKLLPPKFGILGFILDSILSGRVADTVICPVSIQYDKVIETEGYVTELLGVPKKKENLTDFLANLSSVLSLQLGRVDVRFHEPWSLRRFVDEQLSALSRVPAGLDTNDRSSPEVRAVREKLLRTLGYKVLGNINAVSVVMPTALIGTVLLTLRGRGVGKQELVRRVDWLTCRIRAKGGRVAHFGHSPLSEIVERGIEVLGKDLVGVVHDLAEPTYYAVDRFQLSFYRNMTIHLFVYEALVSVAMYTRVKRGGGPAIQDISYDELKAQVSFLSSLFRGEFIFSSAGLIANLDATLRGLEADGVVRIDRDESGMTSIGLSAEERKAGRENYDFYCFLIWPFIEASWLAAVSLLGLTPPTDKDGDVWIQEAKAQSYAQLLGKTLYHQGDLSYFEAVNKETLKNSYSRFQQEHIINVVKTKDSKIPPRIQLDPAWRPSRDASTGSLLAEGKLWDFTEKIASSRREGKNRRDGATVSSRVLRLVDDLGGRLFAEAEEAESRGKGKGKVPSRLSAEEQEMMKRSVDDARRKRKLEGRANL